MAVDPVLCGYCGGRARYKPSSAHLYRLDYGPVWECEPCGAWVGCHPGGTPLGRLADARLRYAKRLAHEAFDPFWRGKMRRDGCSKQVARRKAYVWLAGQLGIERRDCHIGMFDEAGCLKVVEVCDRVREDARARREVGILPLFQQPGGDAP